MRIRTQDVPAPMGRWELHPCLPLRIYQAGLRLYKILLTSRPGRVIYFGSWSSRNNRYYPHQNPTDESRETLCRCEGVGVSCKIYRSDRWLLGTQIELIFKSTSLQISVQDVHVMYAFKSLRHWFSLLQMETPDMSSKMTWLTNPGWLVVNLKQ